MPKRSRKHHYLPRHYLRGFVDRQGAFVIYDKRTGKTFTTSPDATFFENDLNTVELPNGELSDFLEQLYTHLENQSWKCLNVIRSSSATGSIDIKDKMELFLFLSFLHWRLPGNAIHAEHLSQRAFGETPNLDFFRLSTTDGKSPPPEFVEEFRRSAAWKKAAKLIIPFAPFFVGTKWAESILDWRFAYPADGEKWYIVGDNPIITAGTHDNDPEKCLLDFIFPVAGNVVLISQAERLQNDLPPEFAVALGAAIIERSSRFVACHNEAFLSALVDHYELYHRSGKTSHIVPSLFDIIPRKKSENPGQEA
jgi:hypothetical protein